MKKRENIIFLALFNKNININKILLMLDKDLAKVDKML